MLNNNFGELVKKYEKHTSARRGKKLFSLLGLAAIIAAGFFLISKSEFIVNSFKKVNPESNTQTIIKTPLKEEEKKVVVVKEKEEEKPLKRVKVSPIFPFAISAINPANKAKTP